MINKIYHNKDKIDRCFFNKKEVLQAYYDGRMVFNRELFKLITNDIRIGAAGATISDIISDYVTSTRTDRAGNVVDVIYDYPDFTVEPNKTTEEKTGKFKVGQHISNLESEITYVQDKDTTNITYGAPTATRVYQDSNIAANGDPCTILVDFTQIKYESHSFGETYQKEISGTVEVDSIVGEQLIPNLKTTAEGGTVKGTDLGTDSYAEQAVYEISSVTFTANGHTKTVYDKVKVYQEANIRKVTKTTYTLTATALNENPTAAKQSINIDVVSTKIEDYSFTSGHTDKSGALAAMCTVSTNKGTLSTTTVSGSNADVTLTTLANTSRTDTVTYTVVFNNGISKTVTIIQQKDAVMKTELVATGAMNTPVVDGDVGANGSGATVTMTAKANEVKTYYSGETETTTGKVMSVTISTITVSGGTLSTDKTFNGNICTGDNLATTPTQRRIIYYIKKVVGSKGETWNAPTATTLPVYQEANERWEIGTSGGIVTYENVIAGTITNATIPASGGEKTATAGDGSQSWNKTAIVTDYTHTSGAPLSIETSAATKGTDLIKPNYSTLTKSASKLPATASAQKTIGSQTVTWTGSGGKSATGTMYVYQQANAITSYGAVTVTSHGTAADIPVTGGTVRASGGTGKQTITYTSTATRAGTVTCGTYSAVSGSHLHKTEIARTAKGTSSATLTGEGSKTATASVTVYQAANIRTRTYGAYSVSATNLDNNDIPATGGTFKVSVTARRAYTDTYTTTETTTGNVGESGTVTGVNTSNVSPTSFVDSATVTATVGANTGAARTCSVTVSCGGKTATASKTQSTGVVKDVATIVFYNAAYTNAAMTTISYSVAVSAKDTNKYSGGSVGSVKLYVNTKPDGTGTNVTNTTLASSLTVAAGSESSKYTGTFTISSNYAGNVYLLGYLNNKLVSYTPIEEYIPEG